MYCSNEYFLAAFTEALAREVAPFGIRAYIVSPGFFPTNFLATAGSTANSLASDALYPQFKDNTKLYHGVRVRNGQVGDVGKLAKVVFDVAREPLKEGWVRLPVGLDAGTRTLAKLDAVKENVEGTRSLWESTDLSLPEVRRRFGSGDA